MGWWWFTGRCVIRRTKCVDLLSRPPKFLEQKRRLFTRNIEHVRRKCHAKPTTGYLQLNRRRQCAYKPWKRIITQPWCGNRPPTNRGITLSPIHCISSIPVHPWVVVYCTENLPYPSTPRVIILNRPLTRFINVFNNCRR